GCERYEVRHHRVRGWLAVPRLVPAGQACNLQQARGVPSEGGQRHVIEVAWCELVRLPVRARDEVALPIGDLTCRTDHAEIERRAREDAETVRQLGPRAGEMEEAVGRERRAVLRVPPAQGRVVDDDPTLS